MENHHVKAIDMNEEWIVCIIYIAMIDARFVYGSLESQLLNSGLMPSTVTVLLKTSNVRACEFLKRMKTLQSVLTLSDAVCQHLVLVQKKFLISCPLYKKFEKMYLEIFFDQPKCSQHSSQESKNVPKRNLCWVLYVTVKSLIQQQEGVLKLAESFHLLLCCLEHVILMSLPSSLFPPFDLWITMASTGEDEILSKLCQRYGANLEEVRNVKVYYLEAETQNIQFSFGNANISQLLDVYLTLYNQLGDINELDFLENEYYLTTHSIQSHSPPKKESLEVADTPVGQAMIKIQGLKNAFKITSKHPSMEILKLFTECTTNPLQLVTDELKESEGLFVSAYSFATRRRGIARSRFRTATSVYYDIMEALLVSEKERHPNNDLTSLLNKVIFHRSLMASSLELVLHVYECNTFPFATTFPMVSSKLTSNFAFPWILRVLKLKSFDFFKVIDSLVQVKPNLPNYLREHLTAIEDQIISCYGWESGSQVFGSACMTSMPLGNNDMCHSRTVLNESFLSNQSCMESRNDQLQRSRPIILFLSKARRFSLHRLKLLCADLGIQTTVVTKISSCFEYCLQNSMDLFKDRHLDQILMCCLYGIPKIYNLDVKFKDIVSSYKKLLDGAGLKLEKNVLINNEERGPIIHFYNKVFVPELKNYLFMLNPQLSQDEHSPLMDFNLSLNMEIQGMPKKITISSGSPFRVPLTPRSKILYCFKDSPLCPLKLISKSGNQEKKGGASKKLKFTLSDMDT